MPRSSSSSASSAAASRKGWNALRLVAALELRQVQKEEKVLAQKLQCAIWNYRIDQPSPYIKCALFVCTNAHGYSESPSSPYCSPECRGRAENIRQLRCQKPFQLPRHLQRQRVLKPFQPQ